MFALNINTDGGGKMAKAQPAKVKTIRKKPVRFGL